eukprot:2436544-Prymnesium_polylepis.2
MAQIAASPGRLRSAKHVGTQRHASHGGRAPPTWTSQLTGSRFASVRWQVRGDGCAGGHRRVLRAG